MLTEVPVCKIWTEMSTDKLKKCWLLFYMRMLFMPSAQTQELVP
jgi:hypothetical protein